MDGLVEWQRGLMLTMDNSESGNIVPILKESQVRILSQLQRIIGVHNHNSLMS